METRKAGILMSQSGLIYLMGPSGAGKDSLIAHIKAANELLLHIPTRYITRPVQHNDVEQHIYMTLEAFDQAEQEQRFACSWRANGHAYALDVSLHQDLDAGKLVLINGSRAHYPKVAQNLQVACIPVYLHISSEVQTQRLWQRGRENKAQIAERVARSQVLAQALPKNCISINAEQPIAQVYADFKQVIAQQGRIL